MKRIGPEARGLGASPGPTTCWHVAQASFLTLSVPNFLTCEFLLRFSEQTLWRAVRAVRILQRLLREPVLFSVSILSLFFRVTAGIRELAHLRPCWKCQPHRRGLGPGVTVRKGLGDNAKHAELGRPEELHEGLPSIGCEPSVLSSLPTPADIKT